MPGEASTSYSGPLDPEEVEIRQAIRAITMDPPGDEPNSEAERQIDRLLAALNPDRWPALTIEGRAQLDEANSAAAALCDALAEECKVLRIAAEKFFGGNFRR